MDYVDDFEPPDLNWVRSVGGNSLVEQDKDFIWLSRFDDDTTEELAIGTKDGVKWWITHTNRKAKVYIGQPTCRAQIRAICRGFSIPLEEQESGC